MFDDIYDNGALMLGKIKNVIEEVEKEIKDDLDMVFTDKEELLKELKDLQNDLGKDLIVCVNYENPMGATIDYWTYDDKIKEV